MIQQTYAWEPTPAPFNVQEAILVWLGIGVIRPGTGFEIRPPPLHGNIKPPTMGETARLVGATPSQISRMCSTFINKGVRAAVQMTWKRGRTLKAPLPANVYADAVSQATLRQHMCLSLAARAVDLGIRHNCTVTPHRLKQAYNAHGIKYRRMLRRLGTTKMYTVPEQIRGLQRVRVTVEALQIRGVDIVQIDECIFSGKTKNQYTFMGKDIPITLKSKGAPGKYLAVVLAASKNRGIIHWAYNVGKGINGKQFVEFIKGLCKKVYFSKYPGRIEDSSSDAVDDLEELASDESRGQDPGLPLDIALFVDNASIHRYKVVQNYCTHRHVPLVFNEPGRPDLMGVEKIWARAKIAH